MQRARPCMLKPPADSPPQYRPGMTSPDRSTTWHCALILRPARASWTTAVAFVAFTLFARVYIGDHWISDALAGLALGAAVAALAVGWMRAMADAGGPPEAQVSGRR